MVKALAQEIVLQQHFFQPHTHIRSIYFGGGTPSILDATDIDALLKAIKQHFIVSPQVEITIEINPNDLSQEKIDAWKSAGINRYSVGIQSFFEPDLVYLQRSHNDEQALHSLTLFKKNGVTNFSADLIFGIPTGTIQTIQQNLDILIAHQVPHISCYSLTVEPHTLLSKLTKKKLIQQVDNEQQAEEFLYINQFLTQHNYEQYEISNYALPRHHSLHNSHYWSGQSYLGIGPSAHSLNGPIRQWNTKNNMLYMSSIEKGLVPFEQEILNTNALYNEFVMLNLRQSQGLSLLVLEQQLGKQYSDYFSQQLATINKTYYSFNAEKIQLTNAGKLYCDGIVSTLFCVD